MTEQFDGDDWKAMAEQRKAKRAANRVYSAGLLVDNDIKFITHNFGEHLIIRLDDYTVFDFWPGTGKWHRRGQKQYYRGVRNLITAIKAITQEKENAT